MKLTIEITDKAYEKLQELSKPDDYGEAISILIEDDDADDILITYYTELLLWVIENERLDLLKKHWPELYAEWENDDE